MIQKNFIQPSIETFFDEFFGNPLKVKPKENIPQVHYTKDGAYLTIEVPGFNKKNLKVELEDGTIFINGKRIVKSNGEEQQKTINLSYKIGVEFNHELLEATIEDGLLTIFVPNLRKIENKKRISLL